MLGNNLVDGGARVRFIRYPWHKEKISAIQGDTGDAAGLAFVGDTAPKCGVAAGRVVRSRWWGDKLFGVCRNSEGETTMRTKESQNGESELQLHTA